MNRMSFLKRKPPKLSEEATKNFKDKAKEIDAKVKQIIEHFRI